jgi:hypothetical protein
LFFPKTKFIFVRVSAASTLSKPPQKYILFHHSNLPQENIQPSPKEKNPRDLVPPFQPNPTKHRKRSQIFIDITGSVCSVAREGKEGSPVVLV